MLLEVNVKVDGANSHRVKDHILVDRMYTEDNCHKTNFLRATAGTAIAHLSHRNSVCLSVRPSVRLSVCHTGGSGKNGAS